MKDIRMRLLALALQRSSFLRAEEKLRLWDLVDDPASLSVLSLHDLEVALGRRLEPRCWNPAKLVALAEADALLLEKIGARFIQFDELDYPPLLRETARPPFGLYARGVMLDPDRPAVAMVGTRLPTGRGLETARSLAKELAAAGICVVSGLARGIDAAAHRGALDGRPRAAGLGRRGGPASPHGAGSSSGAGLPGSGAAARAAGSIGDRGLTCAVLPCGIESVYPPSNRGLAAAILDSGGLLLSEYPPGTDIQKYRFPERNRIIAGVARACIVVEAPLGSGALITAAEALGEGRDLWVASACLGGGRSAGIDRLASEGAPALGSAVELLADWDLAPAATEPSAPLSRTPARDRQEPLSDVLAPGAGGREAGNREAGRRLAEELGRELVLDLDEWSEQESGAGLGSARRIDLRERVRMMEE